MIDEELYQQAADELNSDRRRPHIWARACALASDDHDEARYLYTNLRVEELLAEREKGLEEPLNPAIIEHDDTLALTPLDDDVGDDEVKGFLDDLPLMDNEEELPSSVSAPSGVDQPRVNNSPLELDPIKMDADAPTESAKSIIDELSEPDPELMADYVPDDFSALDDTYADDGLLNSGLAEEDFVQELEPYVDENDDTSELSTTGVFTGQEVMDDKDFDLDSTSSLNLSADDIAQIQANEDEVPDVLAHHPATGSDVETDQQPVFSEQVEHPVDLNAIADQIDDSAVFDDGTADLTGEHPEDLTQSNMDVLDAHTSELDEMLEDARLKPAEPEAADPELEWLEDDSASMDEEREIAQDREPAIIDAEREPTIIEADPLKDELSRQADELDFTNSADQVATVTDQIEHDLNNDERFAESEQADTKEPAENDMAEAAVAATAAATLAAAPDLSAPVAQSQLANERPENNDYPLDLTEGRKGALWSVYRRDNKAQAVKSGVSWSALFLTLPFLIYRHLFGTALAYLAVWIVAVGGLIISGLAWHDAGSSVTPMIQACTIGFALLAFIGLVYLPFRYANEWRSEKLEERGFELVALAKAKNPGRAIASARRYTALDS